MKIEGFTLAEVLITLGIIGVVAAITIPTLINNHKSVQLRAQLNKTYSTLLQAVNMIYADSGMPVTSGSYPDQGSFVKDLKKYVKVLKDCGNRECSEINSDDYTLNNYKNFTRTSNITYTLFDDGQLILEDGTFIMVENLHVGNLFIAADINGFEKGPNALGQDLFSFQILDNKIVPSGAPGTKYDIEINQGYCSPIGNQSTNGFGCTYKALTESDYFKHLP